MATLEFGRLSQIFLFALLPAVLFKIFQIIKLAHLSELSKIPGPPLNRYSTLPLKLAVLPGQRTAYIDSLHRKYGPIIRIAPREIDVLDLTAFHEIHKIGTVYRKSPWYQGNSPMIRSEVQASMFEVQDNKRHQQLRRVKGPAFSPSAIGDWESQVRAITQYAVDKMTREAEQGVTDVYKIFMFMSFDVITLLSNGESAKQLEQEERSKMLSDIENTMMIGGMNNELPWLWPVLRCLALFVPSVSELANVFTRIHHHYGSIAVRNLRKSLENLSDTSAPSILWKYVLIEAMEAEKAGKSSKMSFPASIKTSSSNKSGDLSSSDIFDRIGLWAPGLIIAGTDTTSTTLTYLVWAVLRHHSVHLKLLSEISSLSPPSAGNLPNYADLCNSYPHLNNIISEALRMYPAAPGSLYRQSPNYPHQLHLSNKTTYTLPSNTLVNTQAQSYHRHAQYWPGGDEDTFRPERWDNTTQSMKDAFMPWGAGARSCIGIPLAMMELRWATYLFFRQEVFGVEGRDGRSKWEVVTKDEDMETRDWFLLKPKGEKCEITLKDVLAQG